jgi:O-methyltransferase involved in polyketide biosynthesis
MNPSPGSARFMAICPFLGRDGSITYAGTATPPAQALADFDVAKYGRGQGGFITVLRTAIIDTWVRDFLADHPAGTVIEIGTGLNTRFERVDNGQVHWIDLDLPDTIELRRKFFADTERRRMIAASALEEAWLPAV